LPGESDDYRRARNDLLRAELALKRQTEAVAAQRRELAPGGEVPEDYTFEEWDPAGLWRAELSECESAAHASIRGAWPPRLLRGGLGSRQAPRT
jgi:hypothetical protein